MARLWNKLGNLDFVPEIGTCHGNTLWSRAIQLHFEFRKVTLSMFGRQIKGKSDRRHREQLRDHCSYIREKW